MNKSDRCVTGKQQSVSACHTVKDIETVQPFPSSGILAENLGLPLPILKSQIGKIQDRAYSYIVRTVKLDHEGPTFEQHGSAPNFQGGVLTLCTCKHQMRATQSTEDWQGVWVRASFYRCCGQTLGPQTSDGLELFVGDDFHAVGAGMIVYEPSRHISHFLILRSVQNPPAKLIL
jgi:hypothetical protein